MFPRTCRLDPGPPDLLQVDAIYRGKRLTAQGYRLSSFVTDLGFRHDLRNRMAVTVAVSDLFDSRKDRIVPAASNLHESVVRRNGGRRMSIALTVPFGTSEQGKEKSIVPAQEDKSQTE